MLNARAAAVLVLLVVACGAGSMPGVDAGAADGAARDAAPGADPAFPQIALDDLQDWERVAEPVFRDPFPGYEVAADPHVFFSADGLRMIYTGDVDDRPAIKMTTGISPLEWRRERTALVAGPAVGTDAYRETAFYRRAADGTHQIYFIGYPAEADYRSEVYLAEADDLDGPYVVRPTPILALGTVAGRPVRVLTSPSVVDHDGRTYLVVLGWDAPGDAVTTVWVLGGISVDDGRTFEDFREVPVPVGMEGQITRGPDRAFYATATSKNDEGRDQITLGRADHPFGPYTMLPRPVIVASGAPFEVDEANAASVVFDTSSRTAYLFWHGANYVPDPAGAYAGGYWVMAASTRYSVSAPVAPTEVPVLPATGLVALALGLARTGRRLLARGATKPA